MSNGIKCLRIIFPIKKWKKSEKSKKTNADMRKLKRMVQNKKDVDEFVTKGERKMKEVEHAVIVTNLTGGATKFWIKTDRSLDEKSNDLFMYKFVFLNKNDVNWRRYIFVIYRFNTLSEYEKECIIEHIKSNVDIDGFELEKIVLKG